MNVSNAGSTNPYAQVSLNRAAAKSEGVGESAQVLLLKKLLEAQRQQAEELTRQLDGKGQILDIRV